jgi:hypothetical protein
MDEDTQVDNAFSPEQVSQYNEQKRQRQQQAQQDPRVQQVRQLAQQHAQQAAAKQFLQRHPEIQAQIIKQQETQRLKDESFEFQLSAQDKRDYIKRHNALREISKDPRFSKEDVTNYAAQVHALDGGMTKSPVERKFPKGREPGKVYVDGDGYQWINDQDGIPKAGQQYKNGKESAIRAQTHQIKAEELAAKRAETQSRRELTRDLLTTTEIDPKTNKSVTRVRTNREIDQAFAAHKHLEQLMSGVPQKASPQQKKQGEDFIRDTMKKYGSFNNAPVGIQKQLRAIVAQLEGGSNQDQGNANQNPEPQQPTQEEDSGEE